MKRLAYRGLTLYTSGPYLLRCCLEFYYVKYAAASTKLLPTVADLTYFIEKEEKGDKHAMSVAAKKRITDITDKVHFQSQHAHPFHKVQRGSWDQVMVRSYFMGAFDELPQRALV